MTRWDLLHLTFSFQWGLIVFLALTLAASVLGNVVLARLLWIERGQPPSRLERALGWLFPEPR